MTLASTTQLWLNGYCLTAGPLVMTRYGGLSGLLEPAATAPSAGVATVAGIGVQRAAAAMVPARSFSLAGLIPVGSDRLDLQAKMAAVWGAWQARPSRLMAGSLYLDVELGPVRPGDLKDRPQILDWTVEGRAVPAIWRGLYDYGVGQAQGIPLIADRPENTDTYANTTTGYFSLNNPGAAPCTLALDVDCSTRAGNTVFLRHLVTGQVVALTLDAHYGYGYLGEESCFLLRPGLNPLRWEYPLGTVSAATYYYSSFRTHFRYPGNVGNRMAETPPLFNPRQQSYLRYIPLSGTIGFGGTTGYSVARVGLPWVMRRNLLLYSDKLETSAVWTVSNVTVLPQASYVNQVYLDKLTATGASSRYVTQIWPFTQQADRYTTTVDLLAGNFSSATIRMFNTGIGGVNQSGTILSGPGVVSGNGTTVITVSGLSQTAPTRVQVVLDTALSGSYLTSTMETRIGLSTGATGDYLYTGRVQLDQGSTGTAYQPTGAYSVDLSDSFSGAGLIVQPTFAQLCLNNYFSAGSSTGWSGAPALTVVASGQTYPDGATIYAGKAIVAGGGFALVYQGIACTGAVVYAVGAWVYIPPGAHGNWGFSIQNGVEGEIAFSTVTDRGWSWQVFSWTAIRTETEQVCFGARDSATAGEYVLVTAMTILAGQATVLWPIPDPATTAALCVKNVGDLAALAEPHNLLRSSERFAVAPWAGDIVGVVDCDGAGPNVVEDAARFTGPGADSWIYQVITGLKPNTAYTFSLWMEGAITPRIVLYESLSNYNYQDCAIDGVPNRFRVTLTTSATGTTLQARIGTNSSIGVGQVVKLFGAQVNEGSLPAPYVRTTASPVLPVGGGLTWPAGMTQNGYVEFTFTWPHALASGKFPAGLNFGLWGKNDGISATYAYWLRAVLGLWRSYNTTASQVYVYAERKHNSTTGISGTAGRSSVRNETVNLFDGGPHVIRLEWQNYLLGGVRTMPFRFKIDGTVVGTSEDAAASYGATAWLAPERLWAAGGSNTAVLRDLSFGPLALPAGATW